VRDWLQQNGRGSRISACKKDNQGNEKCFRIEKGESEEECDPDLWLSALLEATYATARGIGKWIIWLSEGGAFAGRKERREVLHAGTQIECPLGGGRRRMAKESACRKRGGYKVRVGIQGVPLSLRGFCVENLTKTYTQGGKKLR